MRKSKISETSLQITMVNVFFFVASFRSLASNKDGKANAFLERVANSIQDSDSSDFGECVICFEYIESPVITVCGHLFCEDCLDSMLSISNALSIASNHG